MSTGIVRSESMQDLLQRYEPYLQRCRDYMTAELEALPETRVLVEYFKGGKMLRPLLVFVAASVTRNEPRKMIKVAAGLELLHGASLIHDDIVDESGTRRGHPALHAQVGIGAALVLGDYLILRSFALLYESETPYPERLLEALHTMNYSARRCCLGELHELLPSGRLDPEEEYFTIVCGKTASLFSAATSVPLILGEGTIAEIEALRTYGRNVGIAFQIQDDVLDLIGDPRTMGKPVGNSLAKGRLLLPLIYLERHGSPAARREYHRMQQTDGSCCHRWHADLVALLKQEGILDRVKASQDRYRALAVEALDNIFPLHEAASLTVLASYATTWHH